MRFNKREDHADFSITITILAHTTRITGGFSQARINTSEWGRNASLDKV